MCEFSLFQMISSLIIVSVYKCTKWHPIYNWAGFYISSGLHFHVIGEGVVRVGTGRHERLFDKENYIDFRMRLLGEPGMYSLNYSRLSHSA